MNAETRAALTAINAEFYSLHAASFDRVKQAPRPGTEEMAARLPRSPRSVLDVGCGNGRLATYLFERYEGLEYTGVDRSEALLARARERLAGRDGVRLEVVDLLAEPFGSGLPAGPFDLVTLFGVLHHLPGRATRSAVLAALAERVAAGGHLVFNVWRFRDDERIRDKIVPWPEYTRRAGRTIELDELEEGDFILPWSDEETVAYRYVNDVAAREIDAFAAMSGLRLVDDVGVGGPSGNLDRLLIFGREPARLSR